MKQVEKTPEIVAKLQKAVGDGVDTSNLAVFEAIALNSLPIRKKHPIYNGAIHPTPFLQEMAASLNAESLPIYLMHDSDAPTPFGRAFFSDVQNGELRTLFFVDKAAHPDVVGKLDNGTVDQVSVSILPKAAVCADCGFDFLGPESDLFENILTGTDPKGHVMGEDGKHVVVQGLDTFNELSLVGKGGARNARVVNRNDQKLAGSSTAQRLAASGWFRYCNAGGFCGVVRNGFDETCCRAHRLEGREDRGRRQGDRAHRAAHRCADQGHRARGEARRRREEGRLREAGRSRRRAGALRDVPRRFSSRRARSTPRPRISTWRRVSRRSMKRPRQWLPSSSLVASPRTQPTTRRNLVS
jgi:hypothetical protein